MAVRLFVLLIFIMSLSMDLLADPSSNVQLVPGKSTHRFPFFESPTPVLSYNNQVPGPTLRSMQGTVMTVDV